MNWKALIEDRNRFFWVLHTAGWLGYALVHYLGSLLHDLRDIFAVIIFLNAYAGWMITIPLRYVYRRAWNFTPLKIALVVVISSPLRVCSTSLANDFLVRHSAKFGSIFAAAP